MSGWGSSRTGRGLFYPSALRWAPERLAKNADGPLPFDQATTFAGSTAVLLPAATGSASGTTPLGALTFDTHADRLTTSALPSNTSLFTVTFWVRRKSTNPDPAVFFEFDGAGFTTGIGTDGNALTVWDFAGGFTRPLGNHPVLTVDKWYFVAFKMTSSTAASLYLGDEAAPVSVLSGTMASAFGTLTVTTVGGGTINQPPVADVARVRIWNAGLSQAEIDAERLSIDAPVRTSNLSAFYSLSSDASKLVDSSGNGNNLSAPGAGPWTAAPNPMPSPVLPTTGTAAVTLGAATSTATGIYGVVDVVGTASPTLGAATSSATGFQPTTGTIAATVSATSFAIGDPAPAPLDFSVLMPHISLGKPIYGTGADLADFLDGGYGYTDETWAVSDGSWAAINLGAGPSQILVGLSHDNATGSFWTSDSFPAYRLQVSNDSTNGADGTWTTAVTVTGNNIVAREHLISFTGYSWVKLIVDDTTQGQLDEFDVWDASNGTPDVFAFLGDSITNGALQRFEYFGGGQLPSFQDNVLLNQLGHYPLQINVGATGQGVDYWNTNISAALAAHPLAKYWCITLGINDAFSMPALRDDARTKFTNIVNAIISAGKIPIVARTTWTGATGYGGASDTYAGTNLKYFNDEVINYVVNTLGVRRGPDLYNLFYSNRVAYNVNADPHPNETGYKAWTKAWADNLGINPAIYGTVVKTLSAATGSASGSFTFVFSGTASPTLGAATSSASGTHSIAGTASPTLGAATSSGTATHPRYGTATPTLGAATSTASGTHAITGTAAPTLDAATSSGTATHPRYGTAAPSLAAATSAASGTHAIAGTAAPTLAAATSSADAVHPRYGAAAPSLQAATSTASGTHAIAGTASPSLSNATVTASGTFDDAAAGTVAAMLGAATSSASGTHAIAGTASPSLQAATSAGTATHPRYGTADSTLAPATSMVSAGHGVAGTSTPSLQAATSTGTATHPRYGTAAPTLQAATSSADAAHPRYGTAAPTLQAATSSADAVHPRYGTAAPTLAAATSTGTATHPRYGTASSSLSAASSSATGAHVPYTGAVAATLAPADGAALGVYGNAQFGIIDVDLGAATSSATGTVEIRGTATSSLGAATASSSGTHAIAGSSARTLQAATGTATGAAFYQVTGTGASALSATIAEAAGTFIAPISGSGAVALSADTAAASGLTIQPVTGAASSSLGAATSSAAGAHAISGTGAVALTEAQASAAGFTFQQIVGTAASVLVSASAVSAGARGVAGSASPTLSNAILIANPDGAFYTSFGTPAAAAQTIQPPVVIRAEVSTVTPVLLPPASVQAAPLEDVFIPPATVKATFTP